MDRNEIEVNIPVFDRPPDAIALDLDGTLFDSRTRLSQRNHTAIENCITQGIPVIIATSRPSRAVYRYVGDKLIDSCSLILQNGAIAMAVPPLYGRIKEPFPPQLAKHIVDSILKIEPEMRITIEVDGYWFGTNLPREPVELWEFNSATPDMQLTLEAALNDEPTKIAAGGLGRDISSVAEAITRQFGDAISVIPAEEMTFLNITSIKASKPDSLRRLLDSQNITLENVLAFGDDIPDIGLLQACGIPVAVANAVPEVIAVADYCTASNDDDGVAIVLEKMLEGIRKI